MTGIAGDPFGDPDRVFISVVSDQDLTPVAPTPAPVDSPEAVDSEKSKEEAVPEATPEVLAKETPDSPTEFNQTTIEETPDAEAKNKEQERKEKRSRTSPQQATLRSPALCSCIALPSEKSCGTFSHCYWQLFGVRHSFLKKL